MFRFRLRTLLIVLALGPPVLAGAWFAWPYLAPGAALVGTLAVPATLAYHVVKPYRLRTRLTWAMMGTAVMASVVCPLLVDSYEVSWLLGFDTYDVSRLLANVLLLASVACAFAAPVAALASEERVPAGFWLAYVAAAALSVLLVLVTLPWVQAAR
jgi:hypothetical protein